MKKGKDGFYCRYVKRVLDISCVLIAMVALCWLYAIIALLVRVKLGKPVIFKQRRVGKDNREFMLYKFRTMTEDRDKDGVYLPDSERLIPFGKFLRKWSIDELPSLVNILKGEMSVIGPRPLPVRYLDRYTKEQLRRHEVKPGLSNMATVNGRNAQSWENQFLKDIWYVDHVSFAADLKSLVDTVKIVFTGKGATAEDGGSRAEFIGTAHPEALIDEEQNYMKLNNVMKKIIIVGAGGYGRELLQWIKDINENEPTWTIAGFIDDNLKVLDEYECDYGVIGTINDWQPKDDEVFALALGKPATKEKIVAMMKEKGAVFTNVIHPTVTLTKFSRYGEGLVMFPYSKLSVNSGVGDFVTILSSGIGHDVYIGDFSTISGMCTILPNVKIGKRVFLAANVAIAYDVCIGDDAYLGMGSIVMKDVDAANRTFANPARILPG